MRRTKEQAAATRQAIFDAARALFVAHGFDAVSLDQIATAAGVKRGAVHFHFINKPGLLLAICEEEKLPLSELVERLESDSEMPLLDELLAVLSDALTTFHGDRQRRALLRGMMTIGLRIDDEGHLVFVDFDRRLYRLVLAVFEAAAKKAMIAAPWTARTCALAVHACITGLLLHWATNDDGTERAHDGVETFRVLFASFGASTRPVERRARRVSKMR